MKIVVFLIFTVICTIVMSDEKIKWNFANAELTEMIQYYSKATQTDFILDPSVRGKVSIYSNSEVSKEEAFNFISRSLALNGFSWVKINNSYVVRNARSALHDGIPVFKEVPPPSEPEHVATLLFTLKKSNCSYIVSQLGRSLSSIYGEMTCLDSKNVVVINDFTSSLNKIHLVLSDLDSRSNLSKEFLSKNSEKEKKAKKDTSEKE